MQVDKVKNAVSPLDPNLDVSSKADEDFWGFEPDDVDKVVKHIDACDKLLEIPPKTPGSNPIECQRAMTKRPERKKAIEAQKAIRKVLAESDSQSDSAGEGSDE